MHFARACGAVAASDYFAARDRSVLSNAPLQRLEDAFFSQLRLANGTFKTTHSGRLSAFNRLIREHLPPGATLQILDIAVSSGITTAEWFDALSAAALDFELTAGDACLDATIVEFRRNFRTLVDAQGRPLQFEVFGVAINNWLPRRMAYLGGIVLLWLLRGSARTFASLVRNPHRRPAKLIGRELARRSRVFVIEDDLFRDRPELSGKFHVIRAGNILNRNYFSDEQLRAGFRNLLKRLQPDGILAVCRSHSDGSTSGAVFRKANDADATVVARMGSGSEIEPLVLNRGGRSGAPRTRERG